MHVFRVSDQDLDCALQNFAIYKGSFSQRKFKFDTLFTVHQVAFILNNHEFSFHSGVQEELWIELFKCWNLF